jgi:hypothetical protein
MRSSFFAAVVGIITIHALAGCGGGSSTPAGSATGDARITISWPARGRLIPLAANSIKVTFALAGSTVQERIVARPVSGDQSLVTFTNLKVGTLTLTGIAYPNADGTGIAQARGSTPVAIQSGQTGTVTLTMNSTIDHIDISPDPASVYGKPGSAPNFGIEREGGGGLVTTGIAAQANTTYFLVLRARFAAGNDTLDMWVNPVPGQPLPAPDATKTDHDAGTPEIINLGSRPRCQFDELRIGRTWEDVSPTTP